MGAKRTLLNKQRPGRDPGPVALMRKHMPKTRQERMYTPRGTPPVSRMMAFMFALMRKSQAEREANDAQLA